MALSDKALGGLMLLAAAVVFVYYSVWALFLPFLPIDHPLQSSFPPREWAVRLPAGVLLVGLTGIGAFFGVTMLNEAQKQKAKHALKSA